METTGSPSKLPSVGVGLILALAAILFPARPVRNRSGFRLGNYFAILISN